MQRETKLKPDEIMFNSLLDGCAQNNLVDEALTLVKKMEDSGVKPSIYDFHFSIFNILLNYISKYFEFEFFTKN